MPAGTITLTLNSKTVTGSGTAFTTELKVNDFVVAVVGGVTYTVGVAAIASNTSLTLNTAFGGPTTSGLAWTAVPNQTMVGITAQIAADTARAIRGLNYDKDNWQQIYSGSGTIRVTLPDGSTFSGPSWNSIITALSNKADKTALGTVAGYNVTTSAIDVTPNRILKTGDFGLGANRNSWAPMPENANDILANGFYATLGASAVNFWNNYAPLIAIGRGDTYGQLQISGSGQMATRGYTASNGWTKWAGVLSSGSFGVGGVAITPAGSAVALPADQGQMFRYGGGGQDPDYTNKFGAGLHVGYGGNYHMQIFVAASGANIISRVVNTGTGIRSVNTLWGTGNTTVDTNNFIKRASPIARLTNDISKMQPDFAIEGQHIIDGLVSVNAEAEGVNAEKVSTGIYRVTGSVGLSVEGWTIEGPQDNNGNRLCFIESEMDGDALIIRVSSRRFDINTALIVANEPMDIPAGRWIDLRLQMPDDSAWNTRMREMKQQSAEKEHAS